MTSISKTGRNCLLKLDDCSILDSDYIVTESIECTEDEYNNNSFISVLDKSELDIELEICEEILALDDNEYADSLNNNSYEQPFENNELENIFCASESIFENHPGACIDDSCQQGSENNKECDVKVCESPYQSNAETCIDKAKEQLCGNSKLENDSTLFVCESHSENIKNEYNSHDLPSSSNISEDEFDSEVKKCWDILKSEGPSDSDVSDHHSQIPQPEHFNNTTNSYAISIWKEKEIKSENIESAENVKVESPIPEERVVKQEIMDSQIPVEKSTEIKYKKRCCEGSSDSDDSSIGHESTEIKHKKIKSEIHVPNVTPIIERVKDEDELSLFAETDISSTVEEYEVLETADSRQSFEESSDKEQIDVGTKRVLSSVVVVPETDYLDEEREDINDSGWESMKNLSTEEERYRMVRECWKSSKVSDPNRNLSYHSFRKRHLGNSSVLTRKRKATSSLDVTQLNPPKRQRSCTFLYDQNIDSLSAEKQKRKADIKHQMQSEVNQLNNIFFQQEQRLQRQYYGMRNNNAYGQLCNLRSKCQREIENVRQQYNSMANQCANELENGINKLSKARKEVLQFCQFYKGLNSEDPTVLTASQQQELEEMENIYLQFDKLYQR